MLEIMTGGSRSWADTDVGKPVRTADGALVGTVAEVRGGDHYVEVAADADPDALATLGWTAAADGDVRPLPGGVVAESTDDDVRLTR